MLRKFGFIMILVILAVCLLSGGCITEDKDVPTLKELIKISRTDDYGKDILEKIREKTKENKNVKDNEVPEGEGKGTEDTIKVDLYFVKSDKSGLEIEERYIERREGIARLTVGELIKGPEDPGFINIFPPGSRLLDINVKPDGVCIVDLSSEVAGVRNSREEKLMVYALVNTLAQFPTIDQVAIRVEGKKVDTVAGYVKWPEAITPDYNM
ncbi:Sporulation and spore germination [Thermosyntropha lipolytica DSM 11003]|uniref:Sporulation and spore germination n=1 Tax=Thermosyntropha lipolytica DSM 11003 TaxID=1123382 RepID=A0A1M5MSW6_9FIRM|nr:GerMN domain-containing protein [Thermosyntropha lipolytica]SHG80192.1 Sporulation and spore germination [Thermosyntropha lipolytica DSM 11003]